MIWKGKLEWVGVGGDDDKGSYDSHHKGWSLGPSDAIWSTLLWPLRGQVWQ